MFLCTIDKSQFDTPEMWTTPFYKRWSFYFPGLSSNMCNVQTFLRPVRTQTSDQTPFKSITATKMHFVLLEQMRKNW